MDGWADLQIQWKDIYNKQANKCILDNLNELHF